METKIIDPLKCTWCRKTQEVNDHFYQTPEPFCCSCLLIFYSNRIIELQTQLLELKKATVN